MPYYLHSLLKWFKRAAVGFGVAFALLAGICGFFLSPMGQPLLIHWILKTVNKPQESAQIRFDQILTPRPRHLTVKNFKLCDSSGHALMKAPKIEIRLAWMKLLKGQLPVSSINVEQLQVHYPLDPIPGPRPAFNLPFIPTLPFSIDTDINIDRLCLEGPILALFEIRAQLNWHVLGQRVKANVREINSSEEFPQATIEASLKSGKLKLALAIDNGHSSTFLPQPQTHYLSQTRLQAEASGLLSAWVEWMNQAPSIQSPILFQLTSSAMLYNEPVQLSSSGQLEGGAKINFQDLQCESIGWSGTGKGLWQIPDQRFHFSAQGPWQALAPLGDNFKVQSPQLSFEATGSYSQFECSLEAVADSLLCQSLEETFEKPIVWLHFQSGSERNSQVEISASTSYSQQPFNLQAKLERLDNTWQLQQLQTDSRCLDLNLRNISSQDNQSTWHLASDIEWLKSPFANWARKNYNLTAGKLYLNTELTIGHELDAIQANFDLRVDEVMSYSLHAHQCHLLGKLNAKGLTMQGLLLDDLYLEIQSLENKGQLIADSLSWSSWGNSNAIFFQAKCDKQARFDLNDTSFQLQTQGLIDLANQGFRLTIEEIKGSWGGLALQLNQSALVEIAPDKISSSGLSLSFGSGALYLDGYIQPSSTHIRTQFEHLPLDLLGTIFSHPIFGTASGHTTMSLANGQLGLDSSIQLRRLRVDNGLSADSNREATGDFRAKIDKGKTKINAKLTSGLHKSLIASVEGQLGSIPSWRELLSTVFDVQIGLHGELGLFSQLFTIEDFDFDGQIAADISAKGTVLQPDLEGPIEIRGGSYDHYPIGLQLRHVQAKLHAEKDRIILDSCQAKDDAQGSLQINGALSLATPISSESHIEVTNFKLIDIPLACAWTNGKCTFKHQSNQAQIIGNLNLSRIDLHIPNMIPSAVPEFDAYSVLKFPSELSLNPWSNPGSEPTKTLPVATSSSMKFDLDIAIPGNAFLKGRGLDSAWRGHIHLGGDQTAVILNGQIEIVSGELNFGGRRFLVREGIVEFKGNPKSDTYLHIVAELPLDSVTIRAVLNGSLTRPRLQFQATPNLSLPDLFSHILFGKAYNNLSPFQALQVAQLALEASGDTQSDVFGLIRKTTGIDRLEIEKKDGDLEDHDGDVYTVKVGKYLADGFLVSISKNVTTEGTQLTFELDLTKHLSVLTELGYLTSSSINLLWKKDY